MHRSAYRMRTRSTQVVGWSVMSRAHTQTNNLQHLARGRPRRAAKRTFKNQRSALAGGALGGQPALAMGRLLWMATPRASQFSRFFIGMSANKSGDVPGAVALMQNTRG